jgi:hypothetical protein
VLDIKTQNEALLLKNLHKFLNKADIPWVHLIWEKHYSNGRLPNHVRKGSFWWRDILKLLDNFKGMSSVLARDGTSCNLWEDCWHGQPLQLQFPQLHSFAKKPGIALSSALNSSDVSDLFHLPLSDEAFAQFHSLQLLLQNQQNIAGTDRWAYIWGNETFSSRRAYRQLLGEPEPQPLFTKIWKSSCQHNHKVFFWLLVKDRLSTRNILRRRQMHLPSYSCVLCSINHEETVDHLFLECDFARSCWSLIGLTIISSPDPFQRFQSLGQQLNVAFYMEIIIIMCWSIWISRNDLIFRGRQVDCFYCLDFFKQHFRLLLWRAKKKFFPAIEQWLELSV